MPVDLDALEALLDDEDTDSEQTWERIAEELDALPLLIAELRAARAVVNAAAANVPTGFPFDQDDESMIDCLMWVGAMRKLRDALDVYDAGVRQVDVAPEGRLL